MRLRYIAIVCSGDFNDGDDGFNNGNGNGNGNGGKNGSCQ